MRRWLLSVVALCAISGAVALEAHRAEAESPQYLFIQPSYGGYGQLNPAPTYAHGWFGVAPRRMWTFHWDFYGGRWIWH